MGGSPGADARDLKMSTAFTITAPSAGINPSSASMRVSNVAHPPFSCAAGVARCHHGQAGRRQHDQPVVTAEDVGVPGAALGDRAAALGAPGERVVRSL